MTQRAMCRRRAATLPNARVVIDERTTGVYLPDGSLALVDSRDLRDLEERGVTGAWFLADNGQGLPYVRAKGRTNLITVARAIAQAGPDEQVRYRNGNRLDLRRSNLLVTPRERGRRRNVVEVAADLFPNSPDSQSAWLRARAKQRRADAKRSGVDPARRNPAILISPDFELEVV